MKSSNGESVNKLAKLVKELSYDDLVKIRKDILAGNMLRLVEERLDAHENPNKVCPVCNAPLDPKTAITLHFGPQGLRQRASFDGEDCLEYFVTKMAKNKKV